MTAKTHTGISLAIQESNGTYRTASADEIIHAAHSAINQRFHRGKTISSPADARDFLKLRLAHLEHEVFAALWLDNRHRVIAFDELFRGTIDGASVHPREVVKTALKHNAGACILAHNHPSGVAQPSQADQSITQRLKDALNLMDVRILDHVIVAEETYSFAENGLL
ncbi:MAG: DNA repair protein RadC [Gammaproteobacteria bacterium]|nr:DNA repair protein RadC [Gammaproteobacteria bacterium]